MCLSDAPFNCLMLFNCSDKTHKWLKAKVVDVVREVTTRFKVHFNGWKPKHDEWLDAGSFRLAAAGQFTEVVMVDVVKPALIPWYENSAIRSLVSPCLLRQLMFQASALMISLLVSFVMKFV